MAQVLPFLIERERSLSCGERQFGRQLIDNLVEGNPESKIAARQWGVNFCRETSRCLGGPSGRSWPDLKRARFFRAIFEGPDRVQL